MVKKLKIFLFGTPQLEYQNEVLEIPRRKAFALLAYLALNNHPQNRDLLATLFWPDLDQEKARGALRSTLYTLTSLVQEEWLMADRQMVMLDHDAAWIDVKLFVSLLAESQQHSHDPETLCEKCVAHHEQAVSLYRDDLLAGFSLNDESAEYDNWQLFQREWLRREFAGMLRRLACHYAVEGRSAFDSALSYARRWLALDPLHEPAHRLLMRLYALSGERAAAIRQYEECVELLDRELATLPEDETTQLYEAIRSNEIVGVQFVVSAVENTSGTLPPLPTLIIGREDTLTRLKARLGIGSNGNQGSNGKQAMRPLTVIQGWPGVGKSTTVAMLAHDADIPHAFPDGVLWASLGETPDLLAQLLAWAKALNVVDSREAPTLDALVSRLTAILRDRRMLLILDDVWQVEHAAPFRVGGQHCTLVMTSRLNDVAEALAPTPSDVFRLSVLSGEQGLQLLATLAPQAVEEYDEQSRELVRDLEGLPLAIQVAGRLLHIESRLGWGVGELLNELRDGTNLLMAQAPGDMVGPWHDTTPSVAALLRRSTDALDDETRQRFADMGLFVPKPATFDLAAIATLWEVADPKPTVRILVNRGLLEPLSGGRFQMHALLVLHARSLLEQA
jgi:DNA-binding SARP family transcriptional activator